MKKNILEFSLTIFILFFSFYYTEKAIEIVEQKDPIMKKIQQEKKVQTKLAQNASIHGNYLIPGYAGLTIDTQKSFSKMKQYGAYNDSLIAFKEIEPVISKEDYYDKYITTGNGMNQKISFVFPIKDGNFVDEVLEELEKQNVRGTFFVDGVYLEQNKEKITSLAANFHEVEVLSYDGSYDDVFFEATLDNLHVLTNVKGKYCYAEYDQQEILTLCEKEKLHTIIPTIKIDKNPYHTVKGKVRKGSIISMTLTKENVMELPVVLQYLKQRGFVMDTLDNLLSEARNIDK